ncbi:MAG: DNA recombination protein RmuC [Luteococcus sp.]|uniref:DNA recombination protein RmuC n=1 Tax=Luteococcus sp. TaxID=1969402 RepID=UPI002647A347|nr:DNA recombination protein RmuC [Luteococcus sp.]MDN5564820.1 DNA recombination protein RmuC [Luteococcus sp.]
METTAVIMLLAGLLLGLLVGAFAALQVARAKTSALESAGQAALAEARTEAASARAEVANVRADASKAWNQMSEVRADLERAKAETERARTEAALVRAEVSDAETQVAQANALTAQALGEKADVQARLTGMTAERDAAIRRAEELAADRESIENRFKVLSHETLEKQGKQADVVAEARLKATADLMTPVAESLKLMNDRINQVERERASATAEMREQINSVLVTSENLRRETNSLVSALRKPQVRGTWGETQLKRVAELAGMVERCDFDLQTSTTTEDGTLRPDMKVNLADGKCLFVDSKVPLSAFLDAYEAADDSLRDAHLATFARHVRTHIDQLSSKQYWKLEKNTPEFTILFMPSEAFLQAAHEQMPDLHEYAARKNITLATPSILIPLLRAVAHGWQQAALAESAAQVAELGRELYERLGTMGEHLDRVGKGLTSAVGAYNKAVGSLESRVMVTARKFKDLQVTSKPLTSPKAVETNPKPLTAAELTAGPEPEAPRQARPTQELASAEDTPTPSEPSEASAFPERAHLTRQQPTLDELVEDQSSVLPLDARRRTS